MLAITQPIRVGDWVKFEDHYGVVEDVRLNYTFLRTAGETRLVIPNEKLASGILQNDTLMDDAIGLEVAVWIPPAPTPARAARSCARSGADVAVAETVPWGVRLAVGGGPVPAPERGTAEAELRARCHARLRAEGLLEGFSGPGPKLRGDYTGWFAPPSRNAPMSRSQRYRRRRRGRGRHRSQALFAVLVVLIGVGIAGLSVVGWVVATAASAPALTSLKERDPGANTEVLAADGTRLGFISAD